MTAKHRPHRRKLLAALAAGSAALAMPLTGLAADYPERAVRLVVPFPPGGPTDIVARPLAQLLGEALKQSIVVDNRGGAGGSIGADLVAKSDPDGYTLLMGTVGTSAINAALYSHLPHDPVADFTPIALVASAPVAVVVNPAMKVESLGALIEQARAKPGSVGYGSAGNGTPGHLTAVMFSSAAKLQLQHVPYKGSAPAITDLLGNQIPMMFDPLQSVIQHVRSGKLRALAISAKTRSPDLPDVPTIHEAGVKDFESTAWWGVFGPAGMPPQIVERLRKEVAAIVASPAYKEKLAGLGVEPSPEPLSLPEFQKSEVEKWGAAVRTSGAVVN